MVKVIFDDKFQKQLSKIKDRSFKDQINKQIEKIIHNPHTGKPMRYERKGTRELYMKPFRLAYNYHENNDTIEILDLYHKDEQ
jgi:addiction module RelE/StbE family toxin|tara:strand:- start:17 stop:265 length:249 start_codon:yes stop_codon:yes gene_type:complete